MLLSVEKLRAADAFVGAPVKKELKWEKDGVEHVFDVYVRRLSYHTAVSDLRNYASGDPAVERIAHCIVDEQGAPVFTVSDITGRDENGDPVIVDGKERGALDPGLSVALLSLIAEVNNLGKTQAPSSTTTQSSGTS